MERRPTPIERIDFGDGQGTRKLKVTNQLVRDAVIASKQSIGELLGDPFARYPFLMQAIVQAGSPHAVTLDQASKLVDLYLENVGDMKSLQAMLMRLFANYSLIERQPATDDQGDADPNPTSQVGPGPTAV